MTINRTFAFIDLCGFTPYTETRGGEAAVVVLAQLRSTVRALAECHGVRVTKWLGDGAMLSGLQARAVVAATLGARDALAANSPLALRGGIAEGPVIMFEGDDYVGAAVATAARLARRARPNQVLATAPVAEQADGLVSLRPCPALRVHGAEPVGVRELLGIRQRTPAGGSQLRTS